MLHQPTQTIPIAPRSALSMAFAAAASPDSVSPTSSTSSDYTPSPRSSTFSLASPSRSTLSSSNDTWAHSASPTWPAGPSLSHHHHHPAAPAPFGAGFPSTAGYGFGYGSAAVPSSFVSDDDLLPEDAPADYLAEAPPPPRAPSAYLACGAVPTAYLRPFAPRPVERKKKRRGSKRKEGVRGVMSPIVESAEEGPE